MKELHIDLETYSDIDLSKCGVYKYAASDAFEILLFGYSVDGSEVTVVDLAQGEEVPEEVLNALTDPAVTKWAHNCAFERACISAWLKKNYPEKFCSYSIEEDTVGDYLDPEGWRCSMVWAAYVGLPMSLEKLGDAMNLTNKKLSEGRDLIRYFCVPCKPTKTNGYRTRNLPHHDPEKWERFKSYNKRDVEVEMQAQKKLSRFPMPEVTWEEYRLDQEINDRGIGLDLDVVRHAIAFDERSRGVLIEKLTELTGLENPNSVQQLKGWLTQRGIDVDSLGKKQVKELMKEVPEDIKEVLLLRQKVAKSSVRKYQAMENAVCKDSRARGMTQFYGASTGRWAGRIIQLQNLPQNHMPDLAEARGLVKENNYDALEMLYDSVPDVLSQLVRTAFVPRDGYKFVVADFSAIEARVLAWLAGESWRIEVFAKPKADIYCESASAMFHVPVEKHGVNSHLRQRGKVAELALGYGGSIGALKAMGAIEMGMEEEELRPLVDSWRTANSQIVQLWWDVGRCVKQTIRERRITETHGIRFSYEAGVLFIQLPSGRRLAYVKPKIGENRFGGDSVLYMGVGSTKKWEWIETYGARLVENIVQAISRDLLAYAMRTLSYCFINAHVHDELIIECTKDVSVDAICEQMGRTPPWAEGLLLRADGYETLFYRKD
ncbi:MAG: DNA polymerase [Anaerovoracaceae bacterium]